MAKKGEKLSDKTKKKLSKSLKGKTPWNKGRKGVQTAWNKGTGGICYVDRCNNKRQAKGYCDYHYRRFRKGTPYITLRTRNNS